jgi:hypothetical protein
MDLEDCDAHKPKIWQPYLWYPLFQNCNFV